MKHAKLRTQKGVIEVELDIDKNKFSHLKLTGDFFIYPEEAIDILEQNLIGLQVDKKEVRSKIQEIYDKYQLSTPGLTIDDWVEVIFQAANFKQI
ncbi:MAG: hypothetical protein FK734_01680 [Asgard group archaeon]|nr:hypothetical protein [Asgard group archaeon]